MFTTASGSLLRNSNFRHHVFDKAVQAAGLAPLTPHDLRDPAASLAIASGASVKAVQRMLGHTSAAMTLDVYAGLFDDELDGVADRMHAASGREDENHGAATRCGPRALPLGSTTALLPEERAGDLRLCWCAVRDSNPEPADSRSVVAEA